MSKITELVGEMRCNLCGASVSLRAGSPDYLRDVAVPAMMAFVEQHAPCESLSLAALESLGEIRLFGPSENQYERGFADGYRWGSGEPSVVPIGVLIQEFRDAGLAEDDR